MISFTLKRLLPFVLLLCVKQMVVAQVPVTCFEIESILVDACGNPEGENEMVRFIVGPNDLNVANLTVDWPNNNFIGICQNSTTASKVAALNSSVQACGIILEPAGGILPAGKEVLLITSENMDPTFNSFAGLADSLYVIFQCAGNTAGHFKNYSAGSGTRTLIMDFGVSCSDTVTYVVDSLVDQAGLHSAQDGATVNFTWNGADTYTNLGCQAPIVPLSATVTASSDTVCAGDTLQLSAVINSGNFNSIFWTGGSGTIANSGSFNTDYYSNIGFSGTDIILFGIVSTCNDTLFDSLFVQVNSGGNVVVTSSGPYSFCQGDSVVVTASGGSSYLWSTGATTSTITILVSGTFSVTATGACGSSSTSLVTQVLSDSLIVLTSSGPASFCQGDSVILSVTGGNAFQWSNGSTASSLTVYNSGTYSVLVTGTCSTISLSQLVTVLTPPSLNVVPFGAVLCPGSSINIIASGGTNYTWSNGNSGNSINISSPGVYSVISANVCGFDSVAVTITASALQAAFTADIDSGKAPLTVHFTNQSQGAQQYNWDFKDGFFSTDPDPQHTYYNAGTYMVMLIAEESGCSDTAYLSIHVLEDSVSLIIPNVFTPDGDGFNPNFNVIGSGIKLVSGTIYSRWGSEINTWNSIQEGWNGQLKRGGDAPDGDYFYVIYVTLSNGREEVYHGTVTLIR